MFATDMAPYAEGQVSPHGALTDDTLRKTFRDYNRRVAKKYLACTPNKLERFSPEGNLMISTKIDGQLFFLIKKDKEVAFCSPGGRVLQGGPLFEEAKKLLRKSGNIIIAGELFALPPKGGRPRVHFVSTALANEALAPTLGFKAFDLLSEKELDYQSKPYPERFQRLETLLGTGKRVSPVLTIKGTKKDLLPLYQKYVDSGQFEGLVIRSENGFVLKLKPEISIDVVVLGYGEKVEEGQPRLKELVVGVLREKNQYHILGFVGGGFSQEARLEWHSRLSKIQTESGFLLPNREGALCRFVRPEIVIEVRLTDFLLSDGKDIPIHQMVLEYGGKNPSFSPLQPLPLASMLFPRFIQERKDKTPDLGSIGTDQVYRHVPFNSYREHAKKPQLLPSLVIERGVFIKEMGTGKLLRKYLTVETQKDQEEWARYFLLSTDISPNRKETMKTDLKIASSPEELGVLIEKWKKENIKRGWIPA